MKLIVFTESRCICDMLVVECLEYLGAGMNVKRSMVKLILEAWAKFLSISPEPACGISYTLVYSCVWQCVSKEY